MRAYTADGESNCSSPDPVPLTARIESDGLINATPLGMTGRDCLNCDLSHMPTGGWVFDMVTDPADTPLLQAARERGLATVTGLGMPTDGWVIDMVTEPEETPLISAARSQDLKAVGGLEMLVEQAATSFKLFFDKDPPRDRDAELWQKLKK